MRWMWIDRVVLLEPRRRIVALKNISMAEEHLHDRPHHGPLMPASLIIEGMAQSAGILVGHASNFQEKVVLAKVSRAELTEDAPPGFTLRYTATIQSLEAQGASTAGTVELIDPADPAATRHIGDIDLMFGHLDKNMAGAEFPAHNFVFTGPLKTLFETSGFKL